ARSSQGNESAVCLQERMNELGCRLATTELLVDEVVEHARWAVNHLKDHDANSPDVLMMLVGKAGYKTNLFVQGFYKELGQRGGNLEFGNYLESIFKHSAGYKASFTAILKTIESLNVKAQSFDQWEGFVKELWAERDDLQEQITKRRKENNTFTHERQTQAEAEAVLIVENTREKKFRINQGMLSNAYFVSNTRVVDRIRDSGRPITMRPAALLQWLSTIRACSSAELTGLTNGILWELSERGYEVVDRTTIRQTFSPLINASREQLLEECQTHGVLLAEQYGECADRAFQELD